MHCVFGTAAHTGLAQTLLENAEPLATAKPKSHVLNRRITQFEIHIELVDRIRLI